MEYKQNKNLTPTNSDCSLDSLNTENIENNKDNKDNQDNKEIIYNYIPRSYTNDGFVYIPLRKARLTWSKSEGSLPLFYQK